MSSRGWNRPFACEDFGHSNGIRKKTTSTGVAINNCAVFAILAFPGFEGFPSGAVLFSDFGEKRTLRGDCDDDVTTVNSYIPSFGQKK